MGKKYIIYLDTNERACITYISTDGVPSVAMVQATPYEESEAYKRGYDDAKHECEANIQSNRDEAYNKGHRDGLKVGYEKLKDLEHERVEKAYKRGYDDAKHECQDCQKIMMDAEQERVDKAYQQGLEDARNRKATCEFCEYAENDESDEPCVRCCCGYMNMFRPKREPKQIEFGDELRSKNNPNVRVCVTNVKGGKWGGIAISEVIDRCRFGSSYSDRNLDGWEKTGRNFASALQDMMNEKF